MAEVLDETTALESTTVGVYRTAATVKGGRRFSFSAMVVVGNRNGRVGIGYGKANQVPTAIEKAQKIGKRKIREYSMLFFQSTHRLNVDQLTISQDSDAITCILDFGKNMRRENYGSPGYFRLVDQIHHPAANRRIKVGCRFIQNHQWRLTAKRDC